MKSVDRKTDKSYFNSESRFVALLFGIFDRNTIFCFLHGEENVNKILFVKNFVENFACGNKVLSLVRTTLLCCTVLYNKKRHCIITNPPKKP